MSSITEEQVKKSFETTGIVASAEGLDKSRLHGRLRSLLDDTVIYVDDSSSDEEEILGILIMMKLSERI